jgi:hypothetical protein
MAVKILILESDEIRYNKKEKPGRFQAESLQVHCLSEFYTAKLGIFFHNKK